MISFALPVLKTHDIVEDGIQRSTEVVEESGHMEQIFIDSTEQLRVFEVDKCEALGVEGGPAEEEGDNYRG